MDIFELREHLFSQLEAGEITREDYLDALEDVQEEYMDDLDSSEGSEYGR